ncbi:NAD-dependent epimerase/dehydratase family protein [Planctobacterium marinum]|uniref:NAD-dependent epimerase/dehydratase family protein n=1 Tax=Planctobacterium marinum TaxID=1631968 RepID=UPI001E2A1100|nr:NAD(P)-dependent oxidoreductase [Planctobacterium marinum]MCC2606221.1 NAD(P)-dependent oxidoreductase [Planctobacterium marinum]
MKTCLVLGASGNVGRILVPLLATNYKVIAISRAPNPFKSVSNVDYIQHDTRTFDFESFIDIKFDTVYFLIQSPNFRQFPADNKILFDINVKFLFSCVDWAQSHKVRHFCYFSSGGIYQPQLDPIFPSVSNIGLFETDFYQTTKLIGEEILTNYSCLFKQMTIFRPFFIYGPHQRKDMLVPRLIEQIKHFKPITVAGKEGITINPINAYDAAMAAIKSIEIGSGLHRFNLAGTQKLSLVSLCQIIAEKLDVKLNIEHQLDRQDNKNYIADISELIESLYTPTVDISSGIDELICNGTGN